MGFNLSRRTKPGLSVAAAPYRVTLKTGKQQLYHSIKAITEDHKISHVESVYDRHDKNFLDLSTLFNSHRRKSLNHETTKK